MITLGKLGDRIVQIVKTADRVGFSTARGWILICTDWQQDNRRRQQYRWIPADSRFEWARTFID